MTMKAEMNRWQSCWPASDQWRNAKKKRIRNEEAKAIWLKINEIWHEQEMAIGSNVNEESNQQCGQWRKMCENNDKWYQTKKMK